MKKQMNDKEGSSIVEIESVFVVRSEVQWAKKELSWINNKCRRFTC